MDNLNLVRYSDDIQLANNSTDGTTFSHFSTRLVHYLDPYSILGEIRFFYCEHVQ